MILSFDTYYYENKAKTVCLAFENWKTMDDFSVYCEILEDIEEYIPGEFYRRELPCILSLLKKIRFEKIEMIVVDGFVFLDDNDKLGLGGHLYKQLEEKVPIIGVAKTNFASIVKNKRELKRGDSQNPLFITSIGLNIDKAVEYIASMAGDYRIPKLLKHLDSLTKQKNGEQNCS
ncbi:endonuclease V [Pedobacter sp. KBW01]|uniref:endonuclease V n=1 Tax=Pedobacter sp. KBW01 TaxID=2153364 RepID=UPI000F59F6E8|nr:endonuclease V [Pedobacter sp. KBW01]RQO76693.1 endonuclease V [Pedobacter sp. KBW01]